MGECDKVVELAKKITIYDAIMNIKDAWNQLPSSNITNCSKSCSIFNGMLDGEPMPNESESDINREPDKFDHWFSDLLEVPWDEYLAYNDQLELEAPSRAPSANSNTSMHNDNEQEEHETEEINLNVTIDTAID